MDTTDPELLKLRPVELRSVALIKAMDIRPKVASKRLVLDLRASYSQT